MEEKKDKKKMRVLTVATWPVSHSSSASSTPIDGRITSNLKLKTTQKIIQKNNKISQNLNLKITKNQKNKIK